MATVMEYMLAPDGGIFKVTDRGYGYTGMFILRCCDPTKFGGTDRYRRPLPWSGIAHRA